MIRDSWDFDRRKNGLDDTGLEALCSLLPFNRVLTELHLSNIGSFESRLAEALPHLPLVDALSVRLTESSDVDGLMHSIKDMESLTTLRCPLRACTHTMVKFTHWPPLVAPLVGCSSSFWLLLQRQRLADPGQTARG